MKVLVTGACGYIGAVTVDKLIEAGHEVVAVDNLSNSFVQNLSIKAEFLHATDLRGMDKPWWDQLKGIDAVIHLAASATVGGDTQDIFDNNVGSMIHLLKWMKENEIKKLIFASSASVYGRGLVGRKYNSEEDALHPISAYGESKLMCEKLLWWAARDWGLKYVALRYFNVAGATETRGERRKHETHLIPLAIRAALDPAQELHIYGGADMAVRDYVHVEDVADANLLALENVGECGTVYNVGRGARVAGSEVLTEVAMATTTHLRPVRKGARFGDPTMSCAWTANVERELGWHPKHNFRSMVESALAFYQRTQ